MLTATARQLAPLEVGSNVTIPIPDVDKGRAEFRNVLGVVKSISNEGLYEIGTASGSLKQKYTRGEVIPSKGTFIDIQAVPNKEISLREAAQKGAMGDGQGFQRCNCLGLCKTNICGCKNAKRLCTSKCHKSLTCMNK